MSFLMKAEQENALELSGVQEHCIVIFPSIRQSSIANTSIYLFSMKQKGTLQDLLNLYFFK